MRFKRDRQCVCDFFSSICTFEYYSFQRTIFNIRPWLIKSQVLNWFFAYSTDTQIFWPLRGSQPTLTWTETEHDSMRQIFVAVFSLSFAVSFINGELNECVKQWAKASYKIALLSTLWFYNNICVTLRCFRSMRKKFLLQMFFKKIQNICCEP